MNDTSLVSKVKDKIYSVVVELNNDLKIISNLAIQWKMLFSPDLNRQAVEVIFSKKRKKRQLRSINF